MLSIVGRKHWQKQKSKKQLKLNRCVGAPRRQDQAADAQVSRWWDSHAKSHHQTCFHTCEATCEFPQPTFFHHLIHSDTHSVTTSDTQSWALVLLTSSCQFSLNHTIWSTMPSREDSRVGCSSRCICMILLQRHIGAVARIGPGSEAPECCWAPTELGCCCPEASGEIHLWRE